MLLQAPSTSGTLLRSAPAWPPGLLFDASPKRESNFAPFENCINLQQHERLEEELRAPKKGKAPASSHATGLLGLGVYFIVIPDLLFFCMILFFPMTLRPAPSYTTQHEIDRLGPDLLLFLFQR
jgi:hypothetical protein